MYFRYFSSKKQNNFSPFFAKDLLTVTVKSLSVNYHILPHSQLH